MDAYHGISSVENYTAPEFFFKNGKTPQTMKIKNADGTVCLAYVNSTNGIAIGERQLNTIKNQAKNHLKKDAIREGMLERLEKRKAEKKKL